ncbi:MAG: adenosylmethionine--8-amino-7-oxononanoate transaminase [Candidatus Methylomirabilis oxygeniifera]|uniref:Adenosylmethionine-8-amino-7-oxononanoate aminotransferase n=1 Tax=Methylomirabilis oxygeniifera TaxID=671143 RepID=D5MJW8_METO1|nr:MAG: adenosylmethionine--8-amino-7-oxononanoate transaminase [Candidatus Methylomirabilis oxyfera]CBE67551.1 Adenosylmethionine-8-amino-7-oxononanoate aminotransferase (7,8-diamino-pelargonic acid aminotransferase) (DAPA aminotransferase) [Candidatus Methylomirabilis oxyfera]
MASRSRRLQQDDKRYVWHPFTQMQDWLQERHPIIERGEGSTLIDVDGRSYLDGVSSLWVTVHGHRNAVIDQAIRTQLGKIAHTTFLGLSHPLAIDLARALVRIAPKGLTKVFYSDNGSTAVEIALKMAFQYWQQRGGAFRRKRRFIALEEAYHGDTLGAVSVGGIDLFHQLYRPLLFPIRRIPSPYRAPWDRRRRPDPLVRLGSMLARHHDQTAGLVMEPLMQGAAGMLPSPPGFLKAVRSLCSQYNVLLILDEVATGFGRTGTMFACEQEGVAPDLLCLAKGLTGGYLPLAATLATQQIFDGFYAPYGEKKSFFHGHSYTANPLACAAALANLQCFRRERTLERLQPRIAFLRRELESLRLLPHVGDIRQVGFMVGIELMQDPARGEPYPYEAKIGIRTILDARRRGLIIRPLGNVIVLMPPLSISRTDLRRMVRIVGDSIRAATE